MRPLSSFFAALSLLAFAGPAVADDLDDILATGILRHLGYPSANFVTDAGEGLDVDLVRGFAEHLGVGYVYVASSPDRVLGDLTGRHARQAGDGVELLEATPIRGDVIAAGMTVRAWREMVVEFGVPTFPSGVWLVSLAESRLEPVAPADSLADIARVRQQLEGIRVLAVANTRLDPARYDLGRTGASFRILADEGSIGGLIPALLSGDADATLLGVPEALLAVQRWPEQVKIVGPVSENLVVAPAFRPKAARLRAAFAAYINELRADGRYAALVRAHYPAAPRYFPGLLVFQGHNTYLTEP